MEREGLIASILVRNGVDSDSRVRAFTTGFVNATYDIDGRFVLKIERDLHVVEHQPEIVSLARAAGVLAPRIIDAGSVDGVGYLLMEKIPGRRLTEDWLAMSPSIRESLIAQICNQLKLLHSITFDQYAIPRPVTYQSWKDAIHAYSNLEALDDTIKDEQSNAHAVLIRDWFEANEAILDISGPPVLVHNDLHFDNLLHENGVLTGVLDFDFARQAPRDYELWHLVDFLRSPSFFVEQEAGTAWDGYDGAFDLRLFRRHYPGLFDVSRLADRIRLYMTEDLLDAYRNGWTKRFNARTKAYFMDAWLERALGVKD